MAVSNRNPEPSKQKSVTIKSIAKVLGISFSTVSKALNNSPLIKEETKKMVLAKAEEMGYTPNSLARGLRNNESHTIAMILNDIENPVLTHIFKCISVEMAKYGYTSMILDSQFNIETERNNILGTLAQKPDFIILEPASTDLANLKLLSSSQFRLILLGPRFNINTFHQVSVDYMQGGYSAAMNMLSAGHRENLVITTPLNVPNSSHFFSGIRKAYNEFGYELPDERVLTTTNPSVLGGFKVINDLWDYSAGKFSIPFTGIMTFDDNVAYGVYQAAKQLSLRIPEDISVSGFDDNPLSAFSSPSLTTVHLPREKIADSCLEIIKSVLLHADHQTHVYCIEPYLVKRNSVCNLFTVRKEEVEK